MKTLICTSCNTKITNVRNSTVFKCPSCGKKEIVRCYKCRRLGTRYACSECGFKGPN